MGGLAAAAENRGPVKKRKKLISKAYIRRPTNVGLPNNDNTPDKELNILVY